ncbi:MAG: glycosyltransferase family 4 protein [Chitinophagaceae bacterium]|nr:glycosyltransferase family 4 protein [Chitinophagaceae bacterium]
MSADPLKRLKILYINHYGTFGGFQRSILELISAFPQGMVLPHFITPRGTGADYFKKLNIPVTIVPGGLSKFDNTQLSYYRGFRWLILFRELCYAFPTIYTMWKFKRNARDFDIVHVNEFTCILPIILAKKMYKKPVVMHARSVFYDNPQSSISRKIVRLIEKYTDKIIAIDETVASSIPIPSKLVVVHNSFAVKSELTSTANTFAERLATIPRHRLNIGFIGAIHTNKGIVELMHAMKMCRDNNLDVSLLVAGTGNTPRRFLVTNILNLLKLNQDKNQILSDFIAQHKLEAYIHPLGFSTNANDFFRYIDVICFPSHFNALGRPVFEAAFFHKPSIVAIRDPFPDTFVEGKTGLMVEQGNPASIYNAIKKLYDDPGSINAMGEQAYDLAVKNFTPETNSYKVLDIYRSLINAP